jgi:hypothetical protein
VKSKISVRILDIDIYVSLIKLLNHHEYKRISGYSLTKMDYWRMFGPDTVMNIYLIDKGVTFTIGGSVEVITLGDNNLQFVEEEINKQSIMEKTVESVERHLGRPMDETEKVIYDLMKDDDSYEFKVGKDGSLEAHRVKA